LNRFFSREEAGYGRNRRSIIIAMTIVGDPDPDIFGPPGSGSIGRRYGSVSGSGSFPFLIKVLTGLIIMLAKW
jgi:hypothetical protein